MQQEIIGLKNLKNNLKRNSMDTAHEIAVEVWNNYIARPQNNPEEHKFSFKDLEKMIKLKLEKNHE